MALENRVKQSVFIKANDFIYYSPRVFHLNVDMYKMNNIEISINLDL